MKQVTLVFLFLLLAIAYSYASSNPAEEAEHWEKVRQMDQLAERFKAETGFRGEVSYNFMRMKFGTFRGKFADIPFSADADTTAFRQACNSILDKILPYSLATHSQLSMDRISRQDGYTRTKYYQLVNGYGVEGLGFIMITYDAGRYRFSIGDNTVELPNEPIGDVMSESEAYQIAFRQYQQTELYNAKYPVTSRTVIQYKSRKVDGQAQPYRLCWRVSFPSISYYIDVITKYSFSEGYVINQQYSVVVKGTKKGTTLGFPDEGMCALKEVKVNNLAEEHYTDSNGVTEFSLPPAASYQVSLENDRISVRSFSSPTILSTSLYSIIDSLNFETQIGDYMPVTLTDSSYCAPNVFHHISEQDTLFQRLNTRCSQLTYPVTVNDNITLGNDLGNFDPQTFTINLIDGYNPHVIRHEASHYFTYLTMSYHQFYEDSNPVTPRKFQAMDEAFAEYWLTAGINSTIHDYGIARDISTYTVQDIFNSYNELSLPINEDFYSTFWNRYPQASAWWELRSKPTLFPYYQGKNGVDTLLVSGLFDVSEDIDQNTAYRHKPRYFYNILMGNVDTDNIPWPLNAKQAAIDSVYSERGFLFYPKVRSVASASFDEPTNRGTYTLLDSVYVHVKNCPQNTKVKVSVVHDQGYGSVGVTGITIPSAVDVEGNLVCTDAWTDSTGVWAGAIPFSNMLPQGNYDIIVDVGSPNAPDNTLHLVFANDNIIDGVDGLNGSGFTKIGFGDMAVALDLSSSMQTYNIQLAQTVKALEESMIDGERINVFGFTEGTASENWLENGIVDLIGNETRFMEASEIDSTDINSKIEGKKIR